MKYLLYVVFFLLLFSCEEKSNLDEEIAKVEVEIAIERFDKEFAATTPETLTATKEKYPIFFPKQFNDSVWIQRIEDTLQQELNREVQKVFPNNDFIEDELYDVFQHIKYYFPEFKAPIVYTTTSDVDYQNKVILADSILVIGLDTYLGAEHYFYEGIPLYISQNLKKEQLDEDVATAYAKQLIKVPSKNNLLSLMVYYGKELYLKDIWLPENTDAEKIGYTKEQMDWANDNEEYIWRNFIENELLYSTNQKLPARFINPAPFSKFYLEIDNESPGMTGRFIGWQIVRAFMNNTDTTVKELMLINEEELFNQSKYKPKKN
ncbi:gliding motility lipoprotein GldB [Patiriisocius hiemis]|uniref:Gliding motility lipoprotein GldB n=1 Tax=Patiriisocius hiemis TaxID=3075604 RepID=A0ABU2YC54_9FLAO|nr:gliding motility lipoprotein GldB [Constantimarinum sp. W242]MDT0555769.1 gliding motility lipoprotein GldB [Constantimarinum sp. W242]